MKTQLISTGLLSAVLLVQAHALETLEPEDGSYFEVTLTSGKTIAPLATELGFTPTVYLEFFSFTGAADEFQNIHRFLEEVRSVQGSAFLTLEPWNGLESVTERIAARSQTFVLNSSKARLVAFSSVSLTK